MTADTAGESERMRIAKIIDAGAFDAGAWPAKLVAETERMASVALALQKADLILAAGFGDVARAKADALLAMADEVYDTDDGTSEPSSGFYGRLVSARAAEYRK